MGKQTVAVEGSGGLPHRGAGSPAGRPAAAAGPADPAGPTSPTSPAGVPADTGPASHPAPPAAARLVCTGTTDKHISNSSGAY